MTNLTGYWFFLYGTIIASHVFNATLCLQASAMACSPAMAATGTLDPFGIDTTVSHGDLPGNADDQAELALWRRAVGAVTERTVVTGERGQTVTDRHLPPDPKAAQAWLQARRPHVWGNALPPPQRASVAIAVQFITASGQPVGSVLELAGSSRGGEGGNPVEGYVSGAGTGTLPENPVLPANVNFLKTEKSRP